LAASKTALNSSPFSKFAGKDVSAVTPPTEPPPSLKKKILST